MTTSELPEGPRDGENIWPLSHEIVVADIGPRGTDIKLVPDEEMRTALARHLGVLAMPLYEARLNVAPEGAEGVHITGVVKAVVRQTCGVTLEQFDAPVEEDIDVHFVPEGKVPAPESEEDESWDPPDEILNGRIDLGGLATEFLALGIDPYPRKPGAVFQQPESEGNVISPFAALSRLKDQD